MCDMMMTDMRQLQMLHWRWFDLLSVVRA